MTEAVSRLLADQTAADADPTVQINMLGRFQISSAGRRIEGIRGSRLVSIVAYLLLNRDQPVVREQLAFTLWPESTDMQALTNLRRELHLLRRALPNPDRLLAFEHRTVEWRAGGPFALDVSQFEAAAHLGLAGHAEALVKAVELYVGPLLPSCYDDWVEPHRERLRGLFVEVAEARISGLEQSRDYRRAMILARAVIESDVLHEPAYRTLMRIAALAGDRSAGLQAYHACVTNLRQELGVDPDVQTQAAYRRLLDDDTWAVPGPVGPQIPGSAGEPRVASARPAFVGRRRESAALMGAWRGVGRDASMLFVVRGEAGIGKTRLLEELLHWCHGQGHSAMYSRSYAAEGALAYAPIADWLRAKPIRNGLDQLDPVWLSELARVVPELLTDHQHLPRPEPMTERWQRKRLFEAISRAIRSTPAPVLLVLDDAQWADEETLECLHFVLRDAPSVGLLVAASVRAEDEVTNRALTAVRLDLKARDQLIELDLPPLSEEETALLASQALGRPLDDETRARVFRETEGHPLYVVEIVRGGLDTLGSIADERPVHDRLPPRMQAVIASRLQQLSGPALETVAVAATIGRAFTFDVLERASDLEEPALVRALDELWQRQIIREQGLNAYDFGHDRIREVAYSQIAPPRRRLLHRRIAEALQLLNEADPEVVSGRLAAHYEAAGLAGRAIDWYERAARVARHVSANIEAARDLNRAVALIGHLPAGVERDRIELRLNLALPPPIVATRGFATGEVAAALERARPLARSLDDREAEVLALDGLSAAHAVRGEMRRAVETSEAALELAVEYPELLTACEVTCGAGLCSLGALEESLPHFETAVRAYLPGRSRLVTGFEPGVFAFSWGSHALWLSGRTDRAADWQHHALELADANGPQNVAIASAFAAVLDQFSGDEDDMVTRARTAVMLCRQYDFAYYGEWGEILLAWHLRHQPGSASVDGIEAALVSLRSIGAELRRPYFLSLLAEALDAAGDRERAVAVLGAALATANANEERWWLPEIQRRLAIIGPPEERETSFRAALMAARQQGSCVLAVGAALSLARQRPDAADELRATLAALPGSARSRDIDEAQNFLATPATHV